VERSHPSQGNPSARRYHARLCNLVRRLRERSQNGIVLLYVAILAIAAVAVFYFGRTIIQQPWIAREQIGVAPIGDRAYVVGGTSRVADEGLLDEVLELDLTDRTVRLAARLPWSTLYPPVAALDGALYVVGGFAHEEDTYQAGILRIDPDSGNVARVGELPSPRGLNGVTGWNGMLYSAGGWNGADRLDEIVEFDPKTGQTRIVGRLPTPRESASLVAHQDRLYVIGGWDGEYVGEIVEFDPASGEVVRTGQLASPRSRTAAQVLDGRILVFGGKGDQFLNEIVRIDPDGSAIECEIIGRLPEAAADLCFVSVNERLFQFGGPQIRREQDRQVVVREVTPTDDGAWVVSDRITFHGSRE